METFSDQELDLLLSRGKVRGPAADEARDKVLDAVAPRHRPRRWPLRFGVPALSVAAVVAIVAMRLASWSGDSDFRSKGGSAGDTTLLGVTCSNGTPAACHRGARVSLAFAPGTRGYVGAYAEPAGGGERIWYFSREDGEVTLSAPAGGGALLPDRSILLGPEHAAGSYRVHVIVASRPLDRAEILDSTTTGVLLRTSVMLTVLDP
jgi:hypothetical protein